KLPPRLPPGRLPPPIGTSPAPAPPPIGTLPEPPQEPLAPLPPSGTASTAPPPKSIVSPAKGSAFFVSGSERVLSAGWSGVRSSVIDTDRSTGSILPWGIVPAHARGAEPRRTPPVRAR